MQAQEEMIRRRSGHLSKNGKKRSFSSTHVFANIIICGNCGEIYRRVHWNNRGKKSIVWRCVSRLENTGQFCDARTISEPELEQICITAINDMLEDKELFLLTLRKNIKKVIINGNDSKLAELDKRLLELQSELLKLTNSKTDYEDVADEIHKLREEKQTFLVENANKDELKNRLIEMESFLQNQPKGISKYDEQLVS